MKMIVMMIVKMIVKMIEMMMMVKFDFALIDVAMVEIARVVVESIEVATIQVATIEVATIEVATTVVVALAKIEIVFLVVCFSSWARGRSCGGGPGSPPPKTRLQSDVLEGIPPPSWSPCAAPAGRGPAARENDSN